MEWSIHGGKFYPVKNYSVNVDFGNLYGDEFAFINKNQLLFFWPKDLKSW